MTQKRIQDKLNGIVWSCKIDINLLNVYLCQVLTTGSKYFLSAIGSLLICDNSILKLEEGIKRKTSPLVTGDTRNVIHSSFRLIQHMKTATKSS